MKILLPGRGFLALIACVAALGLPAGAGATAAPGSAAAPAPTITLTTPARASSETESSSITLQGTAVTGGKLLNVVWVNQFGHRGSGTVAGAQAWSAPAIPLHMGVNLITVTVIDAANHTASAHVAINRRPVPGALPVSAPKVGVGSWHNRPIVYQIRNGHAIVEGDIVLDLSPFAPPAAPNAAGSTAAPESAGAAADANRGLDRDANYGVPANIARSDAAIAADGSDAAITPDGLGISYTSQLWPSVGGVHEVPYIITTLSGASCTGTGSNTNLTAALSAFNASFAGLIRFVPHSAETNYVNICIDGAASSEGYSAVGRIGNEQPLECGSECTVATWLHEMGHTVGLLHEHQRADRANFITLNLANADLPNVPGNFTLFLYDDQTLGLYDDASVMHYGAFDFSKAGLPVLESIPAGIPLSNDNGYSAGDIDTIKRLYGAAPSDVTVSTNPAGLEFVMDGTTYVSPQSFSFALNTTHTVGLPADPQYTSPADGSTYVFAGWNDQGARSHTITIQPGANTLTAPATEPAVTMYEANFIRLQPFAFASPAAYPSGSGTISVSPAPTPEYGGSFFSDRTLVKLTLAPASGYDLYDWYNLPFPPSDNPHSFYIQSPTTTAQAVLEPSSTPVTIVGDSITGPNPWNPGVAAYVDSNFTLLPSGFTPYYNPGWEAGKQHTVSLVDGAYSLQQQSPVTTNVFYNWNSWSDGGGMTHTITQPSSGTQTIAASFTPFYASYTVPPPLGSAYGSCAGGVSTSPAGSSYANNSSFAFYQDGTSVTSTAAPNPTFPAMTFTGWTGSLSGTTNPQTTTVHDQFVPTATFNLTSAPLAITSLSPSTAIVSVRAAPAVTINGSGFSASANTTYTYWNGSYRPSTVLSPTQLSMQLYPGDLASPGGQDVFVGNYETVTLPGGSTATCGVGAETSFTVAPLPPLPDASSATYVGVDTATQGTWTGKYGSNGYLIANDATNAPAYAAVSLTGDTPYTWSSTTTDPRALQTASGAASRIASAYDSATSFTINVNLTDGKAHRVALYLLDWDTTGRSETVSILDFNTNQVLDTENYSAFNNGIYASWTLKGHVLIQVKRTGGENAVVSGVFFDGIPASSATYAGLDATTEGTWTGKYGAIGQIIANDAFDVPSYAIVSFTGDTPVTWAASTADPRALQTAGSAATRIASAYESTTSFTINLNLSDGNAHGVALYLLDWSGTARGETISILDAATHTVLDTESYADFHDGVYAKWTLQGHVLIEVQRTAGANAVVSGLFF